MKTVREVAFDLGVSKTRILKIINNLPKRKKPKFVGNKYLLNDENIFDISCFITNIESKRNDNLDTDFDNLVIENQQQVIEILKEQNKNKDLQIEQLQKLLENQQILLDRRNILTSTIKELGTYKISLSLKEDVPAQFTLHVIKEV